MAVKTASINGPDPSGTWASTCRIFWWLAALWTMVWAGALIAVEHIDLKDRLSVARARAEAVLEKDQLYREWTGREGGVYAAVADPLAREVPPVEPPAHQVRSPSGQPLTLLNHAHLTRLLHSEVRGGDLGLWARLTSFHPLRPESQPDPWESHALARVETDGEHYEEVVERDHRPLLRYLAPVRATSDCLPCHASHGFEDGKIVGGLTVNIPLRPGGPNSARLEALAVAGLSTLWLLGLLGLRRGAGEIRRRMASTTAAIQARDHSEQRFRTLLEDLPVGVCETDASGAGTYVNRRWCELAGLAPEAARGEGWIAAVHPEDRARVANTWRAAAQDSPGWHQEYRLMDPTGRLTWVHGTAVTLRDASGEGTRLLSVNLEVTEQRRSQAELERNELRFRSLIQHSSDVTLVLSREGRISYASPALQRMSGHEPAAINGQHWSVLVRPEDQRRLERFWEKLLRTPGKVFNLTQTARHRDGSLRWTELLVSNQLDNPAVEGVVVNGRDVTARVAAEQRFREVFQESHVGMALGTLDGRIVEINRTFCAMLDCTPQALLGRHLADLAHPEDHEAERSRIEGLIGGQATSYRAQRRYVHRRDAEVWGWTTMTLLRDPEGRPQFLAIQVQDVTEHRRAEEQLREKAALLEIAQDAICVQSLDGRIEFWNPAAERLYGWTREEALGARVDDLLFSRISRELLQARADNLTHGSWNGELQQAAKDGRVITALCRFSLVRGIDNEPRSVLILSTDLTEKRRLEQQFLRAQRLECIGALASGVAHDLNNVFAPILMASELLAGRPYDGSDLNLVEMVRNSADRGAGIVRQLLAFGRGVGTTLTEIHLEHILKDMQRLGRETFPKSIQFTLRRDPELWPVVADPTQVHQVLLNLCVNARDAMPHGGLLTLEAHNFHADDVFCRMNHEARRGPYVLLQVTDAGTGIPDHLLDKIFDPFFTTKPLGLGTGLGLPTVLTIVQAHRGFIELHSRVGEGTRFRVYLPALEREGGTPSATPAVALAPGHGEMLLVVDDEEAICLATRHYLSQHGYVMLTARDGVEAITRFIENQSKLRVVVTDMVMPGMDGAPFIRAIRKIKPAVAIVAMSGVPDLKQAAQEAGGPGVRFLKKPFSGEELLRVLQEVLQPPGSPGPAA